MRPEAASRLRAPLAALLAAAISGDPAAWGASAFGWRLLFPYLCLFLALEAAESRRELGSTGLFLLGAAAGLAHEGVYAKQLQEGTLLLGVDWLGALFAAFDWGALAVLATAASRALLPAGSERRGRAAEAALASALAAAALWSYAVWTVTGRYRFARMLGPTWLLADALFLAAAAWLARRAWTRGAEEPPAWLAPAAAFCAWLGPAQLAIRAGGGWPALGSLALLAAWTAAFAWLARRGAARLSAASAARALLAIAAYRAAGALLARAWFGPPEFDVRAPLAFAYLVEVPARAAFFLVFFGRRPGPR